MCVDKYIFKTYIFKSCISIYSMLISINNIDISLKYEKGQTKFKSKSELLVHPLM